MGKLPHRVKEPVLSQPRPDQLAAVLLAARSRVEAGNTDPSAAIAEATVTHNPGFPGHLLWKAGCEALEAQLPSSLTLAEWSQEASLDALIGLFTRAATTVPAE